MPKKKSAIDHLNNGREPHIIHLIPPGAPGYAEAKGGAMVVSSPAEVDALIRRIEPGEVVTLDDLRAALARRHKVAVACPVSTAIFANMAARAAEERRQRGVPQAELTPWWRVLRKGGFLNPKLPGGVERQAALLQNEGVRVSPLRKQLAVYDYETRRPDRHIEEA
ncbi:MAG: MGMT family protein [Roseomonas sp.]|jgi:alkylated DNA nucleotide flippase Atl1|uniref:MGMT family protein n=1 Tax=Rhabdaerophilum sp. TaxID=2717341 RepID=UPI0022C94573|nr:MGMT family protein [Roseomonas sp.]MCE2759827.1 MGMT family protein [Acetobacteraceae bacterium]MCA3326319.1 MGMT family protein [Roseomonas sp.]MCA3331431.1 MGMT family protein [Roseomonas sp.]MCA3335510.1 MGMT family protein [Roseomonas sp.]